MARRTRFAKLNRKLNGRKGRRGDKFQWLASAEATRMTEDVRAMGNRRVGARS